jgi:hypothetical protein
VQIVLDQTPFYAESGGQIGDRGFLSFGDTVVRVEDVQKESNIFIHLGKVERGILTVGMTVNAQIDRACRRRAQANHTATHLLQAALKLIVDPTISQAGSMVSFDRLRFDFNCPRQLTPEELQQVDDALIPAGLNSLANKGLVMLNRAAEDATKEATPIFVDAVNNMSFTDAKNILMGNESAATSYLQTNTTSPLYAKFNPVIKNSFTKVGADKVWATIIKKYNSLPMVKKVNPDLTDYTTNKALEGVFKMIGVEEKNIRADIKARTTPLLQKVFAMQDKKQI